MKTIGQRYGNRMTMESVRRITAPIGEEVTVDRIAKENGCGYRDRIGYSSRLVKDSFRGIVIMNTTYCIVVEVTTLNGHKYLRSVNKIDLFCGEYLMKTVA